MGGVIKLGDSGTLKKFGTSKSIKQNDLLFYSPERLKGQTKMESDIWALGVNVFHMLTYDYPFALIGEDLYSQFDSIVNKPHKNLANKCSLELSNLVDEMLTKDPTQRPSVVEIL